MSTESPLGRDLCTIKDVAAFVPGYDPDDETQEILQTLIESVSTDTYLETEREFTRRDTGSDPVERRFELGWWEIEERELEIGDLASTEDLVVTVKAPDGTLLQTLAVGAYVPVPRAQDRNDWEPITALFFPRVALAPDEPAAFTLRGFLDVTGHWGFPVIPPNVSTGVAKLVIVRYAGDVTNAGTELAAALQDVNIGALLVSATQSIGRYRVPTVG